MMISFTKWSFSTRLAIENGFYEAGKTAAMKCCYLTKNWLEGNLLVWSKTGDRGLFPGVKLLNFCGNCRFRCIVKKLKKNSYIKTVKMLCLTG